jgi:ribosomal protein S6E (S10)
LEKNIGESVKGDVAGLAGYELLISADSDKEGFPMRSGIIAVRKRLSLWGGRWP